MSDPGPRAMACASKVHFAYWFVSFATGPEVFNSINWQPYLLTVAAADAICDAASGQDQAACTPNADWNQTAWDISGGVACQIADWTSPTGFKYEHLAAPACQAALVSYRASEPYTCNCSS